MPGTKPSWGRSAGWTSVSCHLRRLGGLAALLLLVGGVGCGRPGPATPGEADTGTGSDTNASAASVTDNPSDGSLVEADEVDLAERIDQARGRVVLVDFWATWCPPCVAKLPHVLDIARLRDSDGLSLITVSMDDVADRDQAQAILHRGGLPPGTHLLNPYGVSTDSIRNFGIEGSLPYYRLYDRSGQHRYSFTTTRELTDRMRPVEELEDRISQLLREEG